MTSRPRSLTAVSFSLNDLLAGAGFYTIFFLAFFSRAFIEGRLLAPGDGLLFYRPAVLRGLTFWDTNILAGYPVFADPQFLTWYPLRWLAPSYNSFVIAAYVIAASLTFGYVNAKVGSRTAALAAGIIFTCGSFMLTHLGHASMIHAVAWLPLVVWAIEALSARFSSAWFAAGTSAVALSLLGGHPQVTVYVLLLAGMLALKFMAQARPDGTKAILILGFTYLSMVAVGTAIAGIQLLPFFELGQLSNRASEWSYGEFVSYSLTLRELPTVLVPYLFGGEAGHFGAYELHEVAIFAGTGAIVLAAIGYRANSTEGRFWLVAAVVSLLIATVQYNGLGRLIFELPILGSFRAQARAGLMFIFAVSVLAAIGISRLQQRQVVPREILLAAFGLAGVVVLLVAITLFSAAWHRGLAAKGGSFVGAAVVPLAIALAMIALIAVAALLVRRQPRSIAAAALLLVLVTLDVARFGWFYGWSIYPPKDRTPPADWVELGNDIVQSGGRALLMKTFSSLYSPLGPNTNLLAGVPLANGYGPMEPRAFQQATGIDSTGALVTSPGQALRKVLALTHVIYPADPKNAVKLGSCAGGSDGRLTVDLGTPVRANELAVGYDVNCATPADGGPIAQIRLLTSTGAILAVPIEAGAQLPPPGGVARLAIPGGPVDVAKVEVEIAAGSKGILGLRNVAITAGSADSSVNLDMAALSFGRTDVEQRALRDGGIVLVDRDAGAMAWLTDFVQEMSTDEAARAVRTGLLPDGSSFKPEHMALLEKPLALPLETRLVEPGTVRRMTTQSGPVAFDVNAASASVLFVSQSFHPGWKATVNGADAEVLRANGAFQGVVVPAGFSHVELRFDPASLKVGGLISLAALLGLALLPAVEQRVRRRLA